MKTEFFSAFLLQLILTLESGKIISNNFGIIELSISVIAQNAVAMVIFVLLVGLVIMKVMFRCVLTEHGDMSVIMTGTIMMLQLFVGNWATLHHVSST